jgi:putative PEP-CTERM system TPR-repeat lipoprotein
MRCGISSGAMLSVAAVLMMCAGCSGPEARKAKFLRLGDAYFAKKDFARASLEYRNALQVRPNDAEAYYGIALTALETGDPKLAAGMLRKAIQLSPSHTKARLKLAEMMAFSRDGKIIREAQKRIQEIVAGFPDNPEAINLLAITEWRLGQRGEAERHLQDILARAPADVKAAITLASIRASQQDLAGAESVLRNAILQSQQPGAALIALGSLYLVNNRPEEAERQFALAVSRDPKDGEALLSLAKVQMLRGQKDRAEQSFRKLKDLPGRQYRLLHAVFLFQNGRRDEALQELRTLTKANPKDREARTLLVSALLLLNRAGEAGNILNQVLARNGKDIEARLQRTGIRISEGNYADAQSDVELVLRYQPDMGEAHYLLAKVFAARGDRLAARQELDTAIKNNPRLLASRIELAKSLLSGRSSRAALDVMNATPPDQAATLACVIQRNWALIGTGNYPEALAGVRRGLQAVRIPELLLQDAVVKMAGSDYAGARRSLEEGLERAPEDARLLQTLAGSYAMQKSMGQAIEQLRRHAERHPGSVVAQRLLGDWLVRTGARDRARAAYLAAKKADPTDVASDLALARLDQSMGDSAAAHQRLTAIVSVPNPSPEVVFALGLLETNMGNRAAAMLRYRQVLQLDPRHPGALNNLAYLLADFVNKPDEALKYAQMAMEADPDNPAVQDTIGWVYYQKGIYHTAVRYLEQAVKAGAPSACYHLGLAYTKLGQAAAANKMLQAALKANPTGPEAANARQMLDIRTP